MIATSVPTGDDDGETGLDPIFDDGEVPTQDRAPDDGDGDGDSGRPTPPDPEIPGGRPSTPGGILDQPAGVSDRGNVIIEF